MAGFAFDGAFRRKLLLGGVAAAAAMVAPGVASAADDLADVKAALAKNHAVAVKRLQDWIALPSIAAENRAPKEGADHMAQLARDAGFQHVEVVPTAGMPGVFATLDAGAPKTLGVYFMYDVKQFDPKEWSSPPLEARLIDKPGMGKIVMGRGAVNQKGPEATFLAALHAMKDAGRKLPVNLVLVAEGEEEIGSTHFGEIVNRADIPRGAEEDRGHPAALRQPGHDRWRERRARREGHCGAGAGVERCQMGPRTALGSALELQGGRGQPGLAAGRSAADTGDAGRQQAGGGRLVRARQAADRAAEGADRAVHPGAQREGGDGGDGHLPLDRRPAVRKAMERLAAEPTINIEGLVAGYTGPGGKTILPGRAVAKIDCRLVPDMTIEEAKRKLRAHLDKRGFTDIEVNVTGGYDPTETDENSKLVQAQLATYKAWASSRRSIRGWRDPGRVCASPDRR
jgi:acetylornithine deacetylase/succinyl-diaminopimelate desuccinylase-like protein